MSDDVFGTHFSSSRIERAWEPPEEVVITRALAESPDLDWEDFGVLIRLLLRDPDQPTNVPDLVEELRTTGWTIGEKPLRRIMRRLKKAGHVSHKREYSPETQRPEWVFRVFRNPANNPQYTEDGVTALSQVRPIGPNRPDREPEPVSDRAESAVYAGQADRAESAGSAPIGPNRPDRKEDVSAGRADQAESARSLASPPHPPEEEELLPPTPHASAGSLPSQREEEVAEFSSEELLVAASFLQEMKRWQAGRKTAQRCAPRLLRAMGEQGWPALSAMDEAQRDLLEADVLRNTGGATSWERCLPGWVEDLRLYAKVAARPAGAASRPERDASKCWKPGHGSGAYFTEDCSHCLRESRPRREGASKVDPAALIAQLRAGRAASGER
ncbi:hypothetical protein [Streptomyces sp. NPDC058664]|uniref:hypothetical protein n=1 Tax=unclassified Streptomyces TaxID=2593676 RepID=UPI00365F09E5